MPRIIEPIPYQPLPVPNDIAAIPRYLEDELNRLAQAMENKRYAYTVIEEESAQLVTATPIFERLYDGRAHSQDYPLGQWNSVAGEWTCQVRGAYLIATTLTGTGNGPSNKHWQLAVGTQSGLRRHEAFTSGQGDMDLSVVGLYLEQILPGHVVYFEWAAITDNPAGLLTDLDAFTQIWKLD